jgi:hypothetical protein
LGKSHSHDGGVLYGALYVPFPCSVDAHAFDSDENGVFEDERYPHDVGVFAGDLRSLWAYYDQGVEDSNCVSSHDVLQR